MIPKWLKLLRRLDWEKELWVVIYWFFFKGGWTVWPGTRKVLARSNRYERLYGKELIIVAGDSLAAGVGPVNSLKDSVAALLGARFPEARVPNLGFNGRDVAGVLQDFSSLELPPQDEAKAKFIVVIVGNVDMMMNTIKENLERDLRELLAILGNHTDHVILVLPGSLAAGPPFHCYERIFRIATEKSDPVRRLFGRVSEEFAHVHFMGEMFDSLTQKARSEPEKWFSSDRFHPGEAWHEEVFLRIMRFLVECGVCETVLRSSEPELKQAL